MCLVRSLLLFLTLYTYVSAEILDNMGNINPDVKKVFSYLGYTGTDDLANLTNYAQNNFIRPKESERYEKESIEHYKRLCASLSSTQKQEVLDLFKKLGDIDEIIPTNKAPDYILIQGSTVQNMRERLMFLSKLIEENKLIISEKTQLFFLTGERALFSTETEQVLLDPSPFQLHDEWTRPDALPDDERHAAQFIWSQLKVTEDLRKLKPIFIAAEKVKGEARATTADAAQKLFESDYIQNGKKAVMVSSNPYIYYQKRVMDLVLKKHAPTNNLQIEGIGQGADLSEEKDIDIFIGLLLDTLARTIYVEKQLQEFKVKP